jgi:HD superfamily phosphodiesterase
VERVARELSSRSTSWWRHTQRVVELARSFRALRPVDEFYVLASAGFLHDVGCAPEVARTSFHPLARASGDTSR